MNLELSILLIFLYGREISAASINIPRNFHIVFKDKGVDILNDVRFFLYTRINDNNPQRLLVENTDNLKKSLYDSTKPTKFITHGWQNSYEGMSCTTIRQALLTYNDYNVIVVDWSNVAKLPYLEAAGRIKVIGDYVAKMINFLESQGGDPNNMSLVGHSLGAQLMGLAGYQTINKVGHVVGLDPAGPGFETSRRTRGLSPKAGRFVEVIHTNMGNVGVSRPLGHVDYYPNGGGPEQPGCDEDDIYCAHDRSYLYYSESVTSPESMMAVHCVNYARFSTGDCNTATPILFAGSEGRRNITRGLYFLRTADSPPFGLGVNGARNKPIREE